MDAASSKDAGAADESSPLKPSEPMSGEGRRRRVSYGCMLNAEEVEITKESLAKTYNIEELVTWRVFLVEKGTVLQCWLLWKQTGTMAILFWGVFICMYFNRFRNFSEFVGSEGSIRAFIAMFSTLIGLLLSFFTALNLARWWQMRTEVEAMNEGCKKLTMLVSQITNDSDLLASIHRYARASLFLVFAASRTRGGSGLDPRLEALKLGLLTEDEASKLEEMNPYMTFVQAETLWVWLAAAMTQLHEQGLTKGAPHYNQLLMACDQGRSGVPSIQAFLETPIPLGYVHLLCLMVKLHNLILTILMALTSVMLSGGEKGFQAVGVFRTAFRAFFMPFLYNAILILNCEVTDPFGEDVMDFDFNRFDINMLSSAKSYHKAAETCPDWLQGKTFAPPVRAEKAATAV